VQGDGDGVSAPPSWRTLTFSSFAAARRDGGD